MNKVITINYEKCVKCGRCFRVCPMQINVFNNILSEPTNKYLQLENLDCIKCGTCIENCPVGALSFKEKGKEEVKYNPPKKNMGKIIKINELTNDVKELVIKFGKEFDFLPGQFILIKMDEKTNIHRAYSLSKIIDKKTIKITIKKIDDGLLSPVLFELKEKDKIEIEGPISGELVLKKGKKDLVFIGTGIGITPFVEIVKQAIKEKRKIKLFHGARTEEELFYEKDFLKLSRENKNFVYEIFLTKPKDESRKNGRVSDFLKQQKFGDEIFYICSKPEAVKEIKSILGEKGISKENIFSEGF